MTHPELKQPPRKMLFVSSNVHEAVTSMQTILTERLGYRVTQSEAVKRAVEALERELGENK
jgi:hypothetical protein